MKATRYEGLNFKLDVVLYRLDQQVACQRYRQNSITAKVTDRVASAWNSVKAAFTPSYAYAVA